MIESPRRRMVLLVDQSEDSRDLYGDWFFIRGFDVVATPLDDVALAIAETYRPDVVLIDLSANTVGGLRLIQRIRSEGGTRHIPIIALTAVTELEGLTAVRNAGVELLRKLGDFEGLERYIATLPPEAPAEDIVRRTRRLNLVRVPDRSTARLCS